MNEIESIEELEALYGAPAEASLRKTVTRLEGAHARWIEASRFMVLSTVGPEGTDGSPRGDVGPVARILDPCLLYTSPSPRDGLLSRMPSSA